MVEWLNQLSSSWLSYFSIMTIQNTAFLSGIFVLMYLFRNQSARFLRFLALLGLVKLLIPPVLFPGSAERIAVAFSPIINALPAVSPAEGATSGVATVSLAFSSGLFILWCLGSIGLGIAISKQWYKTQLLSGIQRQHTVQGLRVPVYCSNDVNTPQVLGIFSPKILVPRSWRNLSEEQQQTILTHELGHIKQRDPYITLLQTVAIIVHFYNPLVWILNHRMNYYSEMACDDYAIAARGMSRSDYLENLLSAVGDHQNARGSLIPIWSFSDTFDKLKSRFQYQIEIADQIRRQFGGSHLHL